MSDKKDNKPKDLLKIMLDNTFDPDNRNISGDLSEYLGKYGWQLVLKILNFVPGLSPFLNLTGYLSGQSSEHQIKALQTELERVGAFLEKIDEQLKAEKASWDDLANSISNGDSGAFHDLLSSAVSSTQKSRSEQKRRLFAQMVVNQAINPIEWDSVDVFVRALENLKEIHIHVLRSIFDLSQNNLEHERRLRLPSIREDNSVDLREEGFRTNPAMWYNVFPDSDVHFLRLICQQLIAEGLISDSGLGGYGIGPLEFFSLTSYANDFLQWLSQDTP